MYRQLIISIALLALIACNQQTKIEDAGNQDSAINTSGGDSSQMQPTYDPALDPLTMGGESIKKLGDSLGLKMYEFTLKPGDSAALHAHPDHVVYIMQGGKVLISFNGGQAQEMEFKTGTAFIGGPLKDAGKNIGKTTIKMLVVDVYRPREK